MSRDHWDPIYIANLAGAGKYEDNVTSQMQKIIELELITLTDDKIIINGWNQYQRDPTAIDRQRRFREKKKVTLGDEKPKVTLSNGSNGIQYSTGQDRTGEEDSRSRCSKIEKEEEHQDESRSDLDKATKSSRLVELCRSLWRHWPQDQIEQSLIILLPEMRGAGVDPADTIRAARVAMPPEAGDHLRAHTWIARQIGIQQRQQERAAASDRTVTVPPEQSQIAKPPRKLTRAEHLASLSPEAREMELEFERRAREKYGHLSEDEARAELQRGLGREKGS